MRARLETETESAHLIILVSLAHAYAAAMGIAFSAHMCDELVLARGTLDVIQRDIRTRLRQLGVDLDARE